MTLQHYLDTFLKTLQMVTKYQTIPMEMHITHLKRNACQNIGIDVIFKSNMFFKCLYIFGNN